MIGKKKSPTYSEQYEQIKQTRSKSTLSHEDYLAKRLREAEEEAAPVPPQQMDWVDTQSSKVEVKDSVKVAPVRAVPKKKESLVTSSEKSIATPVRRKSLIVKYTLSLAKLSEKEKAVLEFLYFAEYNPFQLCVSWIGSQLNLERAPVRNAIVKLAKLGLIKFEGFMAGKNNPVCIEKVNSVKNFLIENPVEKI